MKFWRFPSNPRKAMRTVSKGEENAGRTEYFG
jgi:hypothetical protein